MEVKLIKEMEYERISCTCGMVVLPRDTTPEITQMIKNIAIKEGAKFSMTDIKVHPELVEEYKIQELPAVLIGKNIFRIDERIIREAIRKETANAHS